MLGVCAGGGVGSEGLTWRKQCDGAQNGRLYLVMADQPVNLDEIDRTSDGLVLTEWKLVRPDDDVEKKADEAFRQAALYAEGVLAGIELRAHRYLVLVSGPRIAPPGTREENGIRYEHVNIAVDPDSPSQESRRRGTA